MINNKKKERARVGEETLSSWKLTRPDRFAQIRDDNWLTKPDQTRIFDCWLEIFSETWKECAQNLTPHSNKKKKTKANL
jgi:hypothetical protein